MKKPRFDLGWGNPYFLLEILEPMYQQELAPHDIRTMHYAPDAGIEELRRLTKIVIQQVVGIRYDHILITNGATHAINLIMRHQQRCDFKQVYTRKYGFPFYDDMIKNCGLKRKIIDPEVIRVKTNFDFLLLDSPSNPMGLQTCHGDDYSTIWDAVYHNKIYTNDLDTFPAHSYYVGSYSKLLGLTGSRVGFIATDSEFTHQMLTTECMRDTSGVSVPGQKLIIDILNQIDLDVLMDKGNTLLGYNKEEIQKIEYLFAGQKVPDVGMFYCVKADQKVLKLLKKCGIVYVNLDKDYIRLSLGQTYRITKEVVKTILKEDHRK